jgi:DNA-binding NtrC family response regulator
VTQTQEQDRPFEPGDAWGGGETILVVDDDDAMRESCVQALEEAGSPCPSAASPVEAEPILPAIDLVITDLRMPDGGGTRVIEVAHSVSPDVPIILITAFPSVESAVDAFKSGVVDYLPKPFSGDQLLSAVEHALRVSRVRDRGELLHRMGPVSTDVPEIIGNSPRMREMLAEVRRVAPFDAPVLIGGETGSGKDLVAKLIHRLSPRAAAPFLAQNCAAMPEGLLEAEIFGHERGAFTGAIAARPGLLEQATPGSLFLDEWRSRRRSPRALEAAVAGGDARRSTCGSGDPQEPRDEAAPAVREDVATLTALEVRVPPLRERVEDIPLLAVHFFEQCRARAGRPIVGFEDEALTLLSSHPWPGNVRELQNAIQKMLAHTTGPLIGPEDVLASGAVPSSPVNEGGPLRTAVHEFERSRLAAVLEEHEGNVTHAARALGIHRTTLQRLMRKLDLR